MKSIKFKHEGDIHIVDNGMNHFINGRCVNPLEDSTDNIGSTLTSIDDAEVETLPWSNVVVTGYVPHRIELDDDGNEVFVRL